MASRIKTDNFDFFDDLDAHAFLDPAMEVMNDAFDPAYGEAWSRMQTLSLILMPLIHNQLVMANTNIPAAFTLSRAVADEEELLLIAVHPNFRGLGLGHTLMSRLSAQSKTRGCSQIFLEVRENNGAVTLYRKSGFQKIGERKNYYTGNDGKKHNAMTLAKSL